MTDAKNILVCANETLVGTPLVDAVKRHAAEGAKVHVISPLSTPKHGYVVYEDAVREAAVNRLEMTVARFREEGLEVTGAVEDPDPYSAIMDALGERDFDEIVISTHPETRSGWLRQDLVQRVAQATRRPVEHVVVDLAADKDDNIRVLVVANQTIGGQALLDQLKERNAEEGEHRFIVICPRAGQDGDGSSSARLANTLSQLDSIDIKAIGQVTEPDPFTAIQNALDFYGIDEIVISTFPEARSGWLRGDLIARVRSSTEKPVFHVVSTDDSAEEAA